MKLIIIIVLVLNEFLFRHDQRQIRNLYLLDEVRNLLLDFLESGLAIGRLGGVHLVDTDDQLLDTQGVGEQSVLSSLSVLGDTSLKFTSTLNVTTY